MCSLSVFAMIISLKIVFFCVSVIRFFPTSIRRSKVQNTFPTVSTFQDNCWKLYSALYCNHPGTRDLCSAAFTVCYGENVVFFPQREVVYSCV